MSDWLHTFLMTDLVAVLCAVLAGVACALPGNFLILRRESLLGDAISHAVLPGLIVAFIWSGSRGPGPMFLGAAGAGLACVLMIELIKRLAGVEPSAAIGVSFSVMFAAGVVLVRQYADQVELDANCVLSGNLEGLFWYVPGEWGEFWRASTFFGETVNDEHVGGLPRQLWVLLATCGVSALFVAVFFKELKIATFDPMLAAAQGFSPRVIHTALVVLVAAAVVASFEAVGSILVVAMLVCPGATARLLTDRLSRQVWLSAAAAIIAAVGGYALAGTADTWGAGLGITKSVSAAGMISVMAGVLLGVALVCSPTHGVAARALRGVRLSLSIAREDVLALLYRLEERRQEGAALPADAASATRLVRTLGSRETGRPTAISAALSRLALRQAEARGLIARQPDTEARAVRPYTLTAAGRERAASIVRSHRLWERFMVDELGIRPDHVHDIAERLEHYPAPSAADQMPIETPRTDPHGRQIP